jgi:O-antigen/teichoic acid export membrane protein
MKHSVLGYDPMIGARYYGIGNEFMGVLVGAVVLGTTAALQMVADRFPPRIHRGRVSNKPIRRAKPFIFAVYAAVALYLAAPWLGTNAGGAITAAVAFAVVWFRMNGAGERKTRRLRRLLLLMAGAAALAALLLWVCNGLLPVPEERHSHIGKAIRMMAEGRWEAIRILIERKLAMNRHLFQVSVWSKVLVTGVLVIAALAVFPRGMFRRWEQQRPYLVHGFAANALGAAAALLANDSGIVAAAAMIGYAVVPLLMLRLQEISDSHSS